MKILPERVRRKVGWYPRHQYAFGQIPRSCESVGRLRRWLPFLREGLKRTNYAWWSHIRAVPGQPPFCAVSSSRPAGPLKDSIIGGRTYRRISSGEGTGAPTAANALAALAVTPAAESRRVASMPNRTQLNGIAAVWLCCCGSIISLWALRPVSHVWFTGVGGISGFEG